MAAVAVLQRVLQEPSEGVTQLAELFDRAAAVGSFAARAPPCRTKLFWRTAHLDSSVHFSSLGHLLNSLKGNLTCAKIRECYNPARQGN